MNTNVYIHLYHKYMYFTIFASVLYRHTTSRLCISDITTQLLILYCKWYIKFMTYCTCNVIKISHKI